MIGGVTIPLTATSLFCSLFFSMRRIFFVRDSSCVTVAFLMTEADVFQIEKQFYRIFAMKPYFFMVDAESLSCQRLPASVTHISCRNNEFKENVLDQSVSGSSRIHSKLVGRCLDSSFNSGRGGWTRTSAYWSQSPVPFLLATPLWMGCLCRVCAFMIGGV